MGHSKQNLITPAIQSTNEDACIFAMQLASLPVLPMTLKSAIEIGLFVIVAEAGPGARLTTAEVAATVVKYFTKNEDGVSIYGSLWYYLKDAILYGGIPFNRAHGMSLFEYNGTDPRFNNVFNEAMRNHSTIVTMNILETYKGFEDLKTLVDVAGGVGGTINMIVKKNPHIKGINFDLPHVISGAEPISGVEHVGGDMFASVPSGDAILMKLILHNWSEEDCLKLLKNCWNALPGNGKVVVMESILPVYPEPTAAAQAVIHADVIMLAHCPGGKERTEEEFESLAKEAGFSGSKVISGYASYWILEFHK